MRIIDNPYHDPLIQTYRYGKRDWRVVFTFYRYESSYIKDGIKLRRKPTLQDKQVVKDMIPPIMKQFGIDDYRILVSPVTIDMRENQ